MSEEAYTLGQWVECAPEEYDLEAEYEAKVAPLVERISEECQKAGIPFTMLFQLAAEEGGTVEKVCRAEYLCRKGRVGVKLMGLSNCADSFEGSGRGFLDGGLRSSYALMERMEFLSKKGLH